MPALRAILLVAISATLTVPPVTAADPEDEPGFLEKQVRYVLRDARGQPTEWGKEIHGISFTYEPKDPKAGPIPAFKPNLLLRLENGQAENVKAEWGEWPKGEERTIKVKPASYQGFQLTGQVPRKNIQVFFGLAVPELRVEPATGRKLMRGAVKLEPILTEEADKPVAGFWVTYQGRGEKAPPLEDVRLAIQSWIGDAKHPYAESRQWVSLRSGERRKVELPATDYRDFDVTILAAEGGELVRGVQVILEEDLPKKPAARGTIPDDALKIETQPGRIDRVYPLPQDPKKGPALRDAKEKYVRGLTLDVFNKQGDTKAAWADKARAAMEAYARRTRRASFTFDAAENQAFYDAVAAAAKAGCDDPLVVYWHLRFGKQQGGFEGWGHTEFKKLAEEFEELAKRLPASKYPPALKIHMASGVWNAFMFLKIKGVAIDDADVDAVEKLWWEQLSLAAASDDRLVQQDVFEAVRGLNDRLGLLDGGEGFWKKARKKLEDAKAAKWVVHTLDGDRLIKLAWHARGSGLANTVTREQFKVFQERLEKAKDALEAAHKLDPDRPVPAALMIPVCMGLGLDRDDMEKWFVSAMKADPDFYEAVSYKMEFLMPRWHGSLEEVVEFCDQCLRTKNHDAWLPLVVPHTMKALYGMAPDAFRRSPAHPLLWSRVRAAYEGHLEKHPDDRVIRANFARECYLARQWALANEHFEKLGDNIPVGPFEDRRQMEMMVSVSRSRATVR